MAVAVEVAAVSAVQETEADEVGEVALAVAAEALVSLPVVCSSCVVCTIPTDAAFGGFCTVLCSASSVMFLEGPLAGLKVCNSMSNADCPFPISGAPRGGVGARGRGGPPRGGPRGRGRGGSGPGGARGGKKVVIVRTSGLLLVLHVATD